MFRFALLIVPALISLSLPAAAKPTEEQFLAGCKKSISGVPDEDLCCKCYRRALGLLSKSDQNLGIAGVNQMVHIDYDGNGAADFSLFVASDVLLTAEDFIL